MKLCRSGRCVKNAFLIAVNVMLSNKQHIPKLVLFMHSEQTTL